jgi:hypothetical protein
VDLDVVDAEFVLPRPAQTGFVFTRHPLSEPQPVDRNTLLMDSTTSASVLAG